MNCIKIIFNIYILLRAVLPIRVNEWVIVMSLVEGQMRIWIRCNQTVAFLEKGLYAYALFLLVSTFYSFSRYHPTTLFWLFYIPFFLHCPHINISTIRKNIYNDTWTVISIIPNILNLRIRCKVGYKSELLSKIYLTVNYIIYTFK